MRISPIFRNRQVFVVTGTTQKCPITRPSGSERLSGRNEYAARSTGAVSAIRFAIARYIHHPSLMGRIGIDTAHIHVGV